MKRAVGLIFVTASIVAGMSLTAMAAGYFNDDDGHIFENAIEWLADEGITQGCNPGQGNTKFCPGRNVTRGEMAVFMARAFHLAPAGHDYFADDNGAFYENSVNSLAERGWTKGCDDGRYCGDRPISRGEMAVFLSRAKSLPAVNTNYFSDDNGAFFEGAVNRIAHAGLTVGCGEGRYCGDRFVTRGEMAAFLKRALTGGGSPPTPVDDLLTLSQSSVRPGDRITVRARGFRSSSQVVIAMHSEPRTLKTSSADSQGEIEVTVVIPADAESGQHHIVVEGQDPSGSTVSLSDPILVDFDPPKVVAYSVTPSSTSPGGSVQISASITDATGVEWVGYLVTSNTTGNQVWYGSEGCGQSDSLSLATGTKTNGTWATTCKIPTNANPGTYTVSVQPRDGKDNAANDRVVGTITVNGGVQDFDPPKVVAYSVTPSSTSPGGSVQISASITDATGVEWVGYLVTSNTTGNQVWYGSEGCGQSDSLSLATGTKTNGTWATTCKIPTNANPGTYTVSVQPRDGKDNAANDRVVGTITVNGGVQDFDPPKVVAYSVTPSSTSPGGSVQISASITDATGVEWVGYLVTSNTTGNQVWYGSEGCGQSDSLSLATGTKTNGTWATTCKIPTNANPGTYTVSVQPRDGKDNAANDRVVGTITVDPE